MRTFLTLICAFLLITAETNAEQKVVLISGSTGGIGIATVKAFNQNGWKVWAGYRTQVPLELTHLEDVRFIPLDVCDDAAVDEAIKTMIIEDGRIDALINNAGYGLIGAEECISIEDTKKLFDVNFLGALRLIHAVTPHMKHQQSGHIINISSTSGVRAVPGLGMYAASKFALEGLSESLAVTLSPWNIGVSIVEPGAVKNSWIEHCALGTRPCDEMIYNILTQALIAKLSTLAQQGQECSEIGALIVEIAETSKPNMRYQTSQKVTDTLAKKLVDVSGNDMRNEQIAFFKSLTARE